MSDAINMLVRRVKELEAQVASMQAEAPQATEDAEDADRYRTLRAARAQEGGEDPTFPRMTEAELDAAIDAARKSQGEAP